MRLIDADKLKTHYSWWTDETKELFDTIINLQPTIEAEPVRHGHWVESSEDGTLFCSECGRPTYDTHDEFKEFMGTKIIALVYPYYCGYCGAKMDEEGEDAE